MSILQVRALASCFYVLPRHPIASSLSGMGMCFLASCRSGAIGKSIYLFKEEMNQYFLGVSVVIISFIKLLISHNHICYTLTGTIYTKLIISKYSLCNFYLECRCCSQGPSVLQEG